MSALAYQSVAESQSAQAPNNTTNISANARIDYILRFSKQTIFVVAEQAEKYTPITSQFLATLNTDHNAAFIAVSSQLHDIQIRSRIVEQLFTQALFDPEQSLALSIINLVKATPQKISIAIEHGQFLSTQILHELTQLGEIAKKSQMTIDVVISGNFLLGYNLSENAILFKGKTSILSAENGQLLPLKSSLFKQKLNWLKGLKNIKVVSIIFAMLTIMIGGIVAYQQIQYPADVPELKSVNEYAMLPAEEFVDLKREQANNLDIINALSSELKIEPISQANTSEILTALSTVSIPQKLSLKPPSAATLTVHKPHVVKDIKPILNYDQVEDGYVIQYAAFSDPKVKNDFLAQFPSLEYLSYFRLINGVQFEVLTSIPYTRRSEIEKVKNSLDSSLTKLNVWVKSIPTIKSEIKHYQSSQS